MKKNNKSLYSAKIEIVGKKCVQNKLLDLDDHRVK